MIWPRYVICLIICITIYLVGKDCSSLPACPLAHISLKSLINLYFKLFMLFSIYNAIEIHYYSLPNMTNVLTFAAIAICQKQSNPPIPPLSGLVKKPAVFRKRRYSENGGILRVEPRKYIFGEAVHGRCYGGGGLRLY